MLNWIFTGIDGSSTVFPDSNLINQWKIKEYYISEISDNSCRLGSPLMSVGGISLTSQVNWHATFPKFTSCGVGVVIEGPVGFLNGMDDWERRID